MAYEGPEDAQGEADPDAWEKRTKAVISRHLDQLAAEFDSVQIFVTKHRPEEDATSAYTLGAGNWFARLGHIREWGVRQDAASHYEEIARLSPPEDGCDD